MHQDVREGRRRQLIGRTRRTWGRIIGNERIAAQGHAEVIAGALQESIGIARKPPAPAPENVAPPALGKERSKP